MQSPEVTRSRLYLDAIEKLLSEVQIYVIGSDGGRSPVNLHLTTPQGLSVPSWPSGLPNTPLCVPRLHSRCTRPSAS